MRIHADVTNTTIKNLADIKKLLIHNFGEEFKDTGLVIGYCVSCTIRTLNNYYAEFEEKLKKEKGELDADFQMGKKLSTGVQDSDVVGSGPEEPRNGDNPTKTTKTGSIGSVD